MAADALQLAGQIGEARDNGYSDDEIVDYLTSSRSDLAPRFKEARTNGYGSGEILDYLQHSPEARAQGAREMDQFTRPGLPSITESPAQTRYADLAANPPAPATPFAVNPARYRPGAFVQDTTPVGYHPEELKQHDPSLIAHTKSELEMNRIQQGYGIYPVGSPEMRTPDIAEALGGPAVGPQMTERALMQAPHELRGYTPEELAQPGTFINPRTGKRSTVGSDLALGTGPLGVLDAPLLGGQQIASGIEQMAQPEAKEKWRGAGKIGLGAFEAATPALAGLGAADIPMAAGWWGLSQGVSDLSTYTAKRAGMNDEDAQETGQLIGMLPALWGTGEIALRNRIQRYAQIKAEAAERWQQIGDMRERQQLGADLADRILQGVEQRYSLPDGSQVTLGAGGGDRRGSPLFQLTDETGKNVFTGKPSDILSWIRSKGATPVLPEHAPGAILPEQMQQWAEQQAGRGTGPLAQTAEQARPGASQPEDYLTPEELTLLQRDPNEIRNPRKRDQLIQRQAAVANKIQLIRNAQASRIDPFAGFEEELGEHPTKGAGVAPDLTAPRYSIQGPDPEGNYIVHQQGDLPAWHQLDLVNRRNLSDEHPDWDFVQIALESERLTTEALGQRPPLEPQVVFKGSFDEARSFIEQHAGTQIPTAPSAAMHGFEPGTKGPKATPAAGSPEEPLAEKPEPPPITKSERVSPATPNPPTAAVQTVPESPDTLNAQLGQLATGQRRVVMFPKGGPMPTQYPPGTATTHDPFGNIYVYRDDLITRGEIRRAAANNTLHELLGDASVGLGSPDKSEITPGQEITVVGRAPYGTEVQSTVTDPEHFEKTVQATQNLTPPGGSVSVESPEQVLGERQQPEAPPTVTPAPAPQDLAAPQPVEQTTTPVETPATQVAAPRLSQTGLDKAGGEMASAITGNMYDSLWQKVLAGDVTEAGAPSAVLQAAKMVRDRGGLKTPEEFRTFAQEYSQIPRDQNFQTAMRDLVGRHIPAPAAPLPEDLARPQEVGAQAREAQPSSQVEVPSAKVEAPSGKLPVLTFDTFKNDEIEAQNDQLKRWNAAYQRAYLSRQQDARAKGIEPDEEYLTEFASKDADRQEGKRISDEEVERNAREGYANYLKWDWDAWEAAKRVWGESVGEHARRLNAEHPDWTTAKINHEAWRAAGPRPERDDFPRAQTTEIAPTPEPTEPQDLGTPHAIEAAPQESEAAAPEFKEGDRVQWTRTNGDVVTGTIRGIDQEDGTARVKGDEGMKIPGYHPIGKVYTVPLNLLTNAEAPAPEPAVDLARPRDIEAPEKIEAEEPSDAGTAGTERGGREPVRGEGPRALEGIPAQDVRGPGEGGETLPGGLGGGGEHAGPHADTHVEPEQHAVRPGAGDRVPGVVSPAGGTRASDVQAEPTPTNNLSGDFRLTVEEAAAIENSGAKTRARANLEAIRTIKQIIAEGNRAATLEEQQKIAKFVGWGMSEIAQGIFTGYKREWAGLREDLHGLLSREELRAAEASTQNAHYTRRDIAAAMWDALKRMGFHAGQSVIEPGMGIGNFFMMMPEDLMPGTSRTGVELDVMTGAMSRALFPGSNVLVKGYQETNLPDNYFDAAIGNVPFANHPVVDPAYKRQPFLTKNVHNYFFAKTMDKLRPGGIMFAITSRYTMDGQNQGFRKWMNERAELLGAIRLPRDTFQENAGTSVTVDIIALRKRMPGEVPLTDNKWLESPKLTMPGGELVNVNEYFHAHPEMMMGEMRPGTQYARGYPELFGEFSMDKLKDLFNRLPANVMPDWTAGHTGANDELVENYPDASHIKDHQFGIVNGAVVQRQGGVFKPVTFKGKKLDRMRGLIELRGMAREVIRTQRLDMPEEEVTKARADLNKEYAGFVAEYGPVGLLGNALVFAQDPDWPVVSGLLEDFNKDAYRDAPKAAKDKGKWSVSKDGKQVVLTHGKDRYVIAKTRPIFHGRTIQKPQRIERVDTAAEALAVSLNELGRMDWDRMQELTGRDPATLQKELTGKIFRNPTSNKWETQDEYLSGNVRQKLADAKFIAEEHPEFQANVEALEKVQPAWKPAGKIKASLGATWIPDTDYSRFAHEVLRVEGAMGSPERPASQAVNYIVQTGTFGVNTSPHFSDHGVANTTEFGTAYFDGIDLFEKALNGQSPVARDTYTDMDGNERTVKNPDETIKAVEKQQKLKDAFTNWLWRDPERSQRLEQKFNIEVNNLRLREYDGSHLTFPGLNTSWLRSGKPEPHQQNAVWRTIQSGNTLYAHVVGAGKTLEMIMAAMELRRLGMRKKPLVAVPNHLVQQWADDWMRAYPGAQILVPTKKDFEKQNRQRLMARIASGNYDAVIVGHKSFEKLGVKPETYKNFVEEQLSEIEEAIDAARAGMSDKDARQNPTIKQLYRRKASLEAKLEKRLKKESKDTGLTFEELGVDQIFVDEADLFKNLGYMTQMDRIAGLPNTDSDRATDMLLKTRFVSGLHGGDKGVVFATGTPVSNSIAEIWTMMRYLMPNYLEREGFDQFDAWAKTFGETRTQMEVAPEGGRFIQRTRFSKFKNAAQMMAMFRLVADIRTAKQLNLPTPAVYKGGYVDIVAPASDALKEYVLHIGERADAVRAGEVEPEQDNMLKISSDGRKASLDMRLVRPSLPDDPKSKPNLAVKQILDVYNEFKDLKGTQLVFLDLGTPKSEKVKAKPALEIANKPAAEADEEDPFGGKEEEEEEEAETAEESRERASVYEDIKKKLVKSGIPADEIAFAQDAKTDAQKQDMFDRMNSGKLRVLLGSTEKMGAGTNVQRLLVALHHLDAPWRPRDMQQRDGRIVRQGNWLYDNGHIKSVRLYRYMTEGSFDAFMWETLSSKAAPIEQLMEGDPNMDDVDELSPLVLSYEQAKAISSGNPEIREKIILDQDIHKLDVMRGAFLSEQSAIAQQMATLPATIRATKERIQEYEEDIATRDANPDMIVAGQRFSGNEMRSKGGEALFQLLDSMGPVAQDGRTIDATYRGFELQTIARTNSIEGRTEKGRKARSFVRVQLPDKKVMYYELQGYNDVADMRNNRYMPEEIKTKELSREDAEKVHADWEKTKGEASEIPWRSATNHIAIYTTPGARLKASSGTYAISSPYGSKETSEAIMDTMKRQVEFNDLLKHQRDELRRFTKKQTELESKYGDAFPQEEKLAQMKRRQAELAMKLGETGDDKAALRAAEEAQTNPSNPLYKFLQDPNASIHAKWLPQRKWQGSSSNGSRFTVKGNIVTPELGVSEEKPAYRGAGPTWNVQHIPSGLLIRGGLRTDWHAVDYARKAAASLDWNWTKMPAGFQDKARDFNNKWTPPAETPEQSKERLNADPDEWYVERGEGEVSLEHGKGPLLVRRSEGERGSIILAPQDLAKLQKFAGDLHELFSEDIAPVFKSAAQRLAKSLDDIQSLTAPQTRGEPARKGTGMLREMMSEQDQRRDRAYNALKTFKDYFYKSGVKKHGVYGLDVYDAIETGQTAKLSPIERAFADVARKMFDGRYQELQDLGILRAYIENYLPHEYKKPDQAADWVQGWLQKRPIAGSEAFKKQRKYPTLKEALEDPDFTLEAKFDNPVDFILSKLAQMDKSITAHLVFDELQSEGRIAYVRAGGERQARAQGLAPIDDRIFTVFGPKRGAVKIDIPAPRPQDYEDPEDFEIAQADWEHTSKHINDVVSPSYVRVFGRREMGRYWAAEPLARVINNHLSPGIQLDAFKLWRDANNTLNMIELSASWYHGLTTALNSSFSDIALGLKQLAAAKPIEAGKAIVRGFTPFASVTSDFLSGTKLQKVWDGTEQAPDPMTYAIVDALKKGGGRARQDLYYATNWTQGMKNAWNRQGNFLRRIFGTSIRAPFAAMEQIMKPIMEYLVPRVKLGAFARRAQLELEQRPDMTLDEARERFGKIWDSIDNRFGQLSQKNLFMNGIVRNLMNAGVGRPGWNIGSVRELGGGVYDALKMIGDGARGKPVEFTDRTAFLIALLLGGAVINAVVSWLLSGQRPDELMDYVMPRDGGITEDGQPSRIVLPTYLAKDVYSYLTKPTATLVAKSAPLLSIVGGLARNRTYRNEKIIGHGGVGLGNYLGSFVTPYSVQGVKKNLERGQSLAKTALPLVGIMPAGRDVGMSKAEKIIAQFQQEQRAQVTPAPTEHSRARAQLFLATKSGDMNKVRQIAQSAIRDGTLTSADVKSIVSRAHQNTLAAAFKSLPVSGDGLYTALKAYDAASPEERKHVEGIMREKLSKAWRKPFLWDADTRDLANKLHFRTPPLVHRPDFAVPAEVQ